MPNAPDHNHPDYEQTFSKITTILEKLAETALQSNAHIDRLADAMERLAIKSAESEDKLNALIDLMDRHLREHGKGD
jgi:branched-subunit amino acid aminotransferase/4-amino-4-deoxychorismate lyase